MDSFKGEFFIRTVNPPSDVLFKGEFIRTANPPCHILRGQIPSKDPGKVLFHCRSTLVVKGNENSLVIILMGRL